MDKQNLNDTNSSSSPTPSSKRFRPDMASIRAKQTTTPINNTNNINNKRAQIPPYRNNNQYQRQYHHQHNHDQQQQQQQQILSPSPTRENLEENFKQMINESKTSDIELNMNCIDEQLSEVQLQHCPVKVNKFT
jgi:hypothetical protein